MTTTNRSIVTGIFADEQHAQQAIHHLEEAGFSQKQIRYSPHKSGASILDSLTGMGFGQDEATYYDNEFQQGRTIVTVQDEARQQEAAAILQRSGASFASRHTGQTSDTPAADYATEDAQRLRLREERLQATTTPTQVGEVDLRKEVVSEQQSIDVPVSHEEVYIERRAGSGRVSDAPIGEGETLRVPVSAEQVQVNKQTVETGEVALGKRAVQETQRVSDTVRHEEARVERQGDVTVEGDNTGVQEK
ncbi:MAG TPA: YsnF/AvaK domain-containing protein [Ktedonobacteraceae bacterium]